MGRSQNNGGASEPAPPPTTLLFLGGRCSSAGLKRPLRNAHRWRLWFCADYVRRLSGRLLTFIRPVEANTPPSWWRWAESNRRPERFRIAGITTVPALSVRTNVFSRDIRRLGHPLRRLPDAIRHKSRQTNRHAVNQLYVSREAAAPARRPLKMQPPRNVPSSARRPFIPPPPNPLASPAA